MRSYAAYALIGKRDEAGKGVIPSHLMFYSQQGTPSWTLVQVRKAGAESSPRKDICWTTTEEHALEDGLLLLGMHVYRAPELLDLPGERLASPDVDTVDPAGQFGEQLLAKLRERCRRVSGPEKCILTVYVESPLVNQWRMVDDYAMDVELCLPLALHQTSVRI